jgi:glycosyltransferase involved in cell wall biosynthesis
VDVGHSPTLWQRDRFPASFHDKIYVCHDGIRTDKLVPNKKASVSLGRLGRPLTVKDEIVTYMARNLETTRGFHQFMRALPHIQKARPNARILVIGGNEVSYGGKSKHPGGLRGQMETEVGHLLDWDRLHFLGQVPYQDYQQIIQISSCHIYLTMPFVLSWSLLESMSMGAVIVASDVPPVREAMVHGETGLLVDFFDPQALAAQVVDVLARPRDHAHLGLAARAYVVEKYDFLTVCLPEHIRQINALVPHDIQIAVP